MKRSTSVESLRTRPYDRADETAVLALLRTTLGAGPAGERSSMFFRWKHETNVFGPSYMLVAEADGRIVGLRAFMRWRFRSGGRTVSGVRAVDTATDPDYQGMGIFSRLTREAIDALRGEVDLVFNTPNQSSLPGYLKMGWETVGKVPVWIRVRRPLRFARRIRTLGSDAAPSGGRPRVEAATVAEVIEDRAAIASLLERAESASRRLVTARDVGYLRWRYADAPILDYRALPLDEAGELTGLAIFRVRPRGELWEAMISELIVAPGDIDSARRLLRRLVAAAPVDHLTCHWSSVSGGSRRARAMFVPAPRGIVLVVNPLRPRMAPDPTDLRSWSLSLGDVELF